ncbi:hypothetical protein BU15DRAFT_83208 [Melanogaster broomeanus]|nr:hypothetical protein BU15DRAFT_83208 [Melanogaster broomeanus]
MKENRFVPLKDGTYSLDLEKSLLGANVNCIVDSLSFGCILPCLLRRDPKFSRALLRRLIASFTPSDPPSIPTTTSTPAAPRDTSTFAPELQAAHSAITALSMFAAPMENNTLVTLHPPGPANFAFATWHRSCTPAKHYMPLPMHPHHMTIDFRVSPSALLYAQPILSNTMNYGFLLTSNIDATEDDHLTLQQCQSDYKILVDSDVVMQETSQSGTLHTDSPTPRNNYDADLATPQPDKDALPQTVACRHLGQYPERSSEPHSQDSQRLLHVPLGATSIDPAVHRWTGNNSAPDGEDLPVLVPRDESSPAHPRRTMGAVGTSGMNCSSYLASSRLWTALFAAFRLPFKGAACLKIVQDSLAFIQPPLLYWLLSYISEYQDNKGAEAMEGTSLLQGYAIALVMFNVSMAETTVLH